MNIEADYIASVLELSKPVGTMTWNEAVAAEWPEGWRIPNRVELVSLFDEATNSGYEFGDESLVWTTSPFDHDPAQAWYVYFGNGSSNAGYKFGGNAVRLVRDITPEKLPIRYSTETLYHYRCPKCQQWWTIGDLLLSSAICPKCGYSAYTENL